MPLPSHSASPAAVPALRPRRLTLRAVLGTLAALNALTALAACGGGGGDAPTAVTPQLTTARLDLAAQFQLAAGTTNLTLRVAPAYDRATGTAVALPTQTFTPTGTAAQTLPVTFDLSSCLGDAARAGADLGTGANAACVVRVDLTLLSGDRILDAQSVGPYTVRGGGVNVQAVVFTEVAGVRVTGPDGAVVADGGAARLEVSRTLGLTARAVDAAGAELARSVTWTSDAPTVATVDPRTGMVTPVAPGQARVVAAVSGRQSAVVVTVVPPPATVTVRVAGGAGTGTVTSSPAGISCAVVGGQAAGSGCAAMFPGDVAVTLTAAPSRGSAFVSWSDDCAAAAGATACTLAPGAARTAGVTFAAQRALTVTLPGTGTGQVTSAPAGVDCRANGAPTCTAAFLDGTAVTLTAAPDANSTFAGWGGSCSGVDVTCTVTLDQARSVAATFTTRQATVTLVANGPGSGTLVATGPSIADTRCTTSGQTATCTVTADPGAQITLTAEPSNLDVPGTWSGGGCTGAATTPCTLVVNGDVAVSTSFAPPPPPAGATAIGVNILSSTGATFQIDLVFERVLSGQQANSGLFTYVLGTNASAPQITVNADLGTPVKLTVRPHGTSGRIVSWGGACAGTVVTRPNASCTFTATASSAVTITAGP